MPHYGGYSIDLACRGELRRLAYRCYNCACTIPATYPTYKKIRLVGHKFNARGVRSSVGRVFPRTGITQVSLSAAHAHATCRHVVGSFRRKGASVLVNARVVSGKLSFSQMDIMNVLGTSSVVGCPSFHSCRQTFRLVTRITKETKQGGGRKLIMLRAGSPRGPLVRRVVTGSCAHLCRRRVRRHDLFGCPPFCQLVCMCLGRHGRSVLGRTTSLVTTRLQRNVNRQVLNPSGPPITQVRSLFVQGVIVGVRRRTSVDGMHHCLARMRHALVRSRHFHSLVMCCSMSPAWALCA